MSLVIANLFREIDFIELAEIIVEAFRLAFRQSVGEPCSPAEVSHLAVCPVNLYGESVVPCLALVVQHQDVAEARYRPMLEAVRYTERSLRADEVLVGPVESRSMLASNTGIRSLDCKCPDELAHPGGELL